MNYHFKREKFINDACCITNNINAVFNSKIKNNRKSI